MEPTPYRKFTVAYDRVVKPNTTALEDRLFNELVHFVMLNRVRAVMEEIAPLWLRSAEDALDMYNKQKFEPKFVNISRDLTNLPGDESTVEPKFVPWEDRR